MKKAVSSEYGLLSDIVSRPNKFIITAHETPDGDALGSECAFYFALKQLNKEVHIFNADPAPAKYDYLDPDGAIRTVEHEEDIHLDLSEYMLVVLDTNDIYNIGPIVDWVLPRVLDYLIVDHHEADGTLIEQNHIEDSASSTCEILYGFFRYLNLELTPEIARALYTGIIYDTGSFIYPKTSAHTFSVAYHLVQAGVQPNDIYRRIYESNSISALKLQAKVLGTLEFFFNHHVAAQTMTREMIADCDAIYEEADTLINIPLKSESIRVSLFFKENEQGVLRCSLRSKGNINVASIAQLFGGGGHKTAAGFKSKYPLEKLKEKVLDMLAQYESEMADYNT